jgi:hypothetical protein
LRQDSLTVGRQDVTHLIAQERECLVEHALLDLHALLEHFEASIRRYRQKPSLILEHLVADLLTPTTLKGPSFSP